MKIERAREENEMELFGWGVASVYIEGRVEDFRYILILKFSSIVELSLINIIMIIIN